MAIAGIVATERGGGGWEGVYIGNYIEPTYMGPAIWELLHEKCGGDPEIFVQKYIYDHPMGWANIGLFCYCHDVKYKTLKLYTDETIPAFPFRPEWVYVMSYTHLKVLDATWYEDRYEEIASIPLTGPEPKWGDLVFNWWKRKRDESLEEALT